MKKILLVSLMLFNVSLFAQNEKNEQKPLDENKALFSLGVAISRNLQGYNFSPAEIDKITNGLSEALKGNAKEGDYDFSLIGLYINKKQQENAKAEKEKSKPYLEKMSKEKGAEKSKTGMIYIPLQKGKGESPKPSDNVKVHYKGYLIDGKTFDSSYDRNEPVNFVLSSVIPCWTEGLQKMKVGGKAKLVCPSDIAYGDMGRPPLIPGGATLVFEVELLDIVKDTSTVNSNPAVNKKEDKSKTINKK
jgi:FKBP-type peptidyl-prolyl cis-trans isomerase FkpA